MKGILGGHPGESGVFRTDHDGGRSGAAGRSDTPAARPSAAATDSPEQAAVIHAPTDADMLVVAGAGSGKTYTMTRRIVNLIEHGVRPESILGLTFTRKAASELAARVSGAVCGGGGAGARGRSPDSEFLKPQILTYDAFFQSIVRQYGLLVGFNQDTQPLSDAGSYQLITTVIGRHMDELAGRGLGAFSTIVAQVGELSAAISGSMIGMRCTGMERAISSIRDWDKAFSAQLDAAIADQAIVTWNNPGKPPKRRKHDSDRDFAERMAPYREKLHDYCVRRCDDLRTVVRQRDLLLDLVADYEMEKKRLNMAQFSDFTIAALQLVTRFPSIGERYRARISHVLLDEYQDTSTTQSMLLAALFHPRGGMDPGEGHGSDVSGCAASDPDASRSAGPGPASGHGPVPGSPVPGGGGTRCAMNAVGDPFQSIYAWRGASPGAFRLLHRAFGLDDAQRPYALSVTRRNARLILRAANNLTQPLRRPARRPSSALAGEVDVASLHTLPQAPLGTVGVLGFDTLGQEIDAVGRFARHAIRRHSPAAGSSAKDRRPHVAVLFRSKASMPLFEMGLRKQGLSTMMVGYSAVLERPEIRDVLALLHAVADHTDSGSLMRLLATPRFNLRAKELAALADMARDLNMRNQFRALVQAGLASPDTKRSRWGAVVAEHRDSVPNSVFLADVLMRDDIGALLESSASIGPHAARSIMAVAHALQEVRGVSDRPLAQMVRTAIEALGLDIDTLVACAIRSPHEPVSPAAAHSALDAMVGLVETYVQEIAQEQRPTLRGFVSWIDSLGSIRDDSAAFADAAVDVVLMTIHQAKGLEWDSVAVVGLSATSFPSNQGDGLSVTADEDHPGGMREGEWVAPEYEETARTWLQNPAAVPVPVRVDASVLPRFPHDAAVDADPVAALGQMDDVEVIDDEVFGDLRSVTGMGDGMDEVDHDGWYLTQSEEYGRRLHADERRLAYVALTRAREEVLLTFSAGNGLSRAPEQSDAPHAGTRGSKASNFWLEIHDSLLREAYASNESADRPAGGAQVGGERADTLDSRGVGRPDGYFAGDHAAEFTEAVVDQAWNEPMPQDPDGEALPWPCGLSEGLRTTLDDGARAALHAMSGGEGASSGGEGTGLPDSESLVMRARMLTDDDDLMQAGEGHGLRDAVEFDRRTRDRARRLLSKGRQNVTSLQIRAGGMNERQEHAYWRGIVRPIPRVASPAAEKGTLFHAWAQEYFESGLAVDVPAGQTDDMNDAIARTSGSGGAGVANPGDDDVRTWRERLVGSRWARRRAAFVERQIVAEIPALNDAIVNGKLDAVFYGGLDAGDETKRFTVVDWKTGRRPHKPQDISEKLIQLDLYRLLLSAMESVPLDSIDATLYYLSEPSVARRELHAREKTEKEILAELSSGIPLDSDND